jgi:hypothetical protein
LTISFGLGAQVGHRDGAVGPGWRVLTLGPARVVIGATVFALGMLWGGAGLAVWFAPPV